MTLDLDKFRFKDGATPLSAEEFNARFFALVRRLHVLEQLKVSWEGVVAETTNYGLIRINEAVKPLVDELAADMQALLDEGQAVIDAVSVHAERQDNPHGVTADQAGADPAGTAQLEAESAAATAVADHEGAFDHPAFIAHAANAALHFPDATDVEDDDVLTPVGWRSVRECHVGDIVISTLGVPRPGTIEACGALLSRSAYPELFAYWGEFWGAGDGVTTFGSPDLRGVAIRGWDNGRGLDSGRSFGSYQTDQFKSHRHSVGISQASSGYAGQSPAQPVNSGSMNTSSTGGNETRMKNVALMFCIVY